MIYFKASIRAASACSDDAITVGSVGIPVSLDLAPEFSGLAKTLVFTDGSVSVDVALTGDAVSAAVPHEVLTVPQRRLALGIYAAAGDGTIVIPTVWADAGVIYRGVEPSGVDPAAPTPSWVAQVQSIASEANENAESALNKATAVEEAAAAGEFDGTDGLDGSAIWTTTTAPAVSTPYYVFALSSLSGQDNRTPAVGDLIFYSSAYYPIVSVTDQVQIRIALARIASRVSIKGSNGTNGTDGTDGYSPTVTVEEIAGGHRVTITDVNGDHVFDVMDGQGGGGGGAVNSVNGQTGDVILDAEDVGALPDDTPIPTKTSDLVNDSGFITSAPVTSVNSKTGAVVLTASDVGAGTYSKPSGGIPKTDLASAVQTSLGKADSALQSAPVTSVAGKTGAVTLAKGDVGLGNVDNVQQYSVNNPPPYPVTSVNGSTGAVTLSIPSTASDVGAVAVNQGVSHAGEFVVVGSDGNITTVTLATWQGGSF